MSSAQLDVKNALGPQSAGAKKVRRNPPLPAGSRPKKNPNPFPVLNVIKVPVRVFRPPKATGMVGSVRSLRSTPMSDVRLEDVIANKHLSPLSLKDFEGHLVFKEYSAENLYFILWLNEYTREYNEWRADPASANAVPEVNPNATTDPFASRSANHLPEYLAESLRRGLEVFFSPDAPLELNLSSATRDKVLVEAGASGAPSDFAAAREVVEQSLNRSLAIHSRNSVANAGPRRLVFCFCLGLSVFLLGLVPAFVGIFGNYARAWRAIGLPFIWFGTAVMTMALKRICGVIWLLGEDRQLLPWELASPTVTSGSIVPIQCPSTPGSVSSWDSYDDDKSSPDASFRTATSANPYPWEKQETDLDATETGTNPDSHVVNFSGYGTPTSSRPPSYMSKNPPKNVVPESAPVWGACTAVWSPDVAKAQWSIAIFSFMMGAVALCTVGVVLMAVPNHA